MQEDAGAYSQTIEVVVNPLNHSIPSTFSMPLPVAVRHSLVLVLTIFREAYDTALGPGGFAPA